MFQLILVALAHDQKSKTTFYSMKLTRQDVHTLGIHTSSLFCSSIFSKTPAVSHNVFSRLLFIQYHQITFSITANGFNHCFKV